MIAILALLAVAPLDEARRHYQRLEYDQALALLEDAKREPGADLAQVWLLEAFIHLALGRTVEGATAMRRALTLDGGLKLPADASPKLRAAYDEAKRVLAERKARRAALAVRDLQAQAPPVAQRGFDVTVQVDRAFDGVALYLVVSDARAGARLPMTQLAGGAYGARVPAELAAASATLKLSAEVEDDGEVIAKTEPLSVKLPAHRAAIEVSSPHEGAEVSLDGAVQGAIPLAAALPAEPGTRKLLLRTGDGEVSQDVELAPGQIAAVTLKVTGASKRVRAGISLMVASGIVLVSSVVFAALSAVSARQLEGAVRREPGSGLPLSDYGQVAGLERAGTAFQVTAIVTAIAGALGVGLGAFLWFGADR
jgi:hypothetical protein